MGFGSSFKGFTKFLGPGLVNGFDTPADQANSATAQAVQNQMNFQQYNSDTAYQRAVKDMRAAGINPMLAAVNGGASTPSGASYTAQQSDPLGFVGDKVGSAIGAIRGVAEIDNLVKTGANIQSQTKLNDSNAALSANSAKSVALDLPKKANAAAVEKTPYLGKGLSYIDRIFQSITGAGNSAKSFSQGRDQFRGYNAQGMVIR